MRTNVTPERVARYYVDMVDQHDTWGGAARGWHYGVWEEDVRTQQEAILRSCEVLVRGIPIGPETRILDVGCGGGGFAVFAAKQFGCHVTGITIARPNVAQSRRFAVANGVGDRCTFRFMDMDGMKFPAESFDVVVNQETHCYAQDKKRYLESVFRVLRPGGFWSSIDFTRRETPLDACERKQLRRVLEAWHFPSFARPSDIVGWANRAGFEQCEARDLTPLVLASAAHVMRGSYLPLRLVRAFPKKKIHSPDPKTEANFRGYCEGGMQFSIGLHTGVFHAILVRGRKPG